jgi:putative peptidoglycan lipid II flippase
LMKEPKGPARADGECLDDLGTPAQEAARVAKATGQMSGLTVSSRILGLLRDVAQAAVLGTGMAADAFTLAFIIPNTLRRLFGEATVSAAFVPTYTEYLLTGSRERAFRLGNSLITFISLILAVLVVIGIAAAPLAVKIFAPGFSAIPGKAEMATGLLRLLFPYILMVGTASVVMGILNAHRHFYVPALAPVLFNVASIAGILLLSRAILPGQPVWGYSIGVMAGGVLQLLVQLPALRKKGYSFRPDFHWRGSGIGTVGKLAFPALVGLLAAEVNIIVDQMLASVLEPGSVSALSYGNRIMQFPQGVFAISLATALLPTLSRQTASGRLDDAQRTLRKATLALCVLMVPVTLCMVFLSGPVVRVLLSRGAFSEESAVLTATALAYYSTGLFFFSAVKITAPVFYALKDTRTPVRIAIGCMGLNIVLNIAFTWGFTVTGLGRPLAGLALATSVSAMVNYTLLMRALKGRLGPGGGLPRAILTVMALAAAASTGLLVLLTPWVRGVCESSKLAGMAALLGLSLAAIALFLVVFAFAGGSEARSVFRLALRRGSVREP